jgi:hypothetical protein
LAVERSGKALRARDFKNAVKLATPTAPMERFASTTSPLPTTPPRNDHHGAHELPC